MANFEACVQYVLYQEDSHRNPGIIVNEGDGVGFTRLGITQKYYASQTPADFWTTMPLAPAVAIAKQIYRTAFWNPIHGDAIPFDEVAACMLSCAVNENHGIKVAVQILQRVLDITADGVIGPETISVLQGKDPAIVAKLYRAEWADTYHQIVNAKPSDAKFLNGWIARTQVPFPNPVQPNIYA